GSPRHRTPIAPGPIEVACAAGTPAGEIAARFSAPVQSAITVEVPLMNIERATPPRAGAAESSVPAPTPPAPEAPRLPVFQPMIPAPVRASDLFWLALALLIIIGT